LRLPADNAPIESGNLIQFGAIVRASPRKRLWLGSAGVALFIATVLIGDAAVSGGKPGGGPIGLDFIAFYTAGTFVREGRTAELYDLPAIASFQHELGRKHKVDIGGAYGPWWNPPFYALLFVPLSRLPYIVALRAWVLLNVLCAGASCILLCRLLPRGTVWRSWLLVPVLMALSTPFIFAISHGQNTCTSLIFLTVTVVLWRASGAAGGQGDKGTRRQGDKETRGHGERTAAGSENPAALDRLAVAEINGSVPLSLPMSPSPLVPLFSFLPLGAGAIGGLLFYKPQLALVVGIVLVIDLGWKALLGYAITGFSLLLINLLVLPGTLVDYLRRLPANLHFVQTQSVYLWERHVTFKAFWRLLLQGASPGETVGAVSLASAISSLAIAALLLRAVIRKPVLTAGRCSVHQPGEARLRRDRVIAATIAATPLLMPFYFDYDLLLLAVPAVLFVREFIARGGIAMARSDRLLLIVWPAFYLWLMLNADVAAKTRLNLSVPLLMTVVSLLIFRINATAARASVEEAERTVHLAQAA
jgi:hypothetical protein